MEGVERLREAENWQWVLLGAAGLSLYATRRDRQALERGEEPDSGAIRLGVGAGVSVALAWFFVLAQRGGETMGEQREKLASLLALAAALIRLWAMLEKERRRV